MDQTIIATLFILHFHYENKKKNFILNKVKNDF